MLSTGSKHLKACALDSAKCPYCENTSLETHVYQNYFAIFWIPVFPYSKTVFLECTHCKLLLIDKEIPRDLQRETNKIKKSSATPLYLFIGLFPVIVGIGYLIYSEQQESEYTQIYLSQPRVNDYYVLNIENNEDPSYKYVVYKLTIVDVDSLQFSIGQYTYQASYNAKDAIYDGYVKNVSYFGDTLLVARSDMDINKIKAIIRLSEND